MTGESRTTTDHQQIRQWAELRGGIPTTVAGTAGKGEHVGILRIEFPESGEERRLEPIEWDEFFDKFEQSKLAFLFQEQTKTGQPSRFFKFVNREKH